MKNQDLLNIIIKTSKIVIYQTEVMYSESY
jgi:hypothetical protein